MTKLGCGIRLYSFELVSSFRFCFLSSNSPMTAVNLCKNYRFVRFIR